MEQLSFLDLRSDLEKVEGTVSEKTMYCLWNGEYGEHDLSHINGLESIMKNQNRIYPKYIGIEVGDFICIGVEYDWGKRDQRWRVKCKLCGEETYKYHTHDWKRGHGSKTECHCRKDKEKEKTVERRNARLKEISEETGKIYGKYKIVEYKGYNSCKVRCIECGAIRSKGVTVSKLRAGEYPKCDCGKPHYSDPKWLGMRVGHLVSKEHTKLGYFVCKCDCGSERVVKDTYFARGRYRDCGDPKCEYIGEAKSEAINARIRGNTYEALARGIIESSGYNAKLVGKSGDFGVDIIATAPDGMKIAVQCKSNMNQLTGVSAVQQAYAGGRYFGLEHFAVISHSGYSKNAVMMAKKLGVYLSDGKEFIYPDDMKKYVNSLIPTYKAVKNMKAQKLYELNGQRKTLSNWAFEHGTDTENVRKGLKMGLTLENALQYKKNGRKQYTVDDFTGTLPEIVRHFHPPVSEQTIRTRMRDGMTIEKAMFTPPCVQGRPKKENLGQIEMLF